MHPTITYLVKGGRNVNLPSALFARALQTILGRYAMPPSITFGAYELLSEAFEAFEVGGGGIRLDHVV